MHFLNGFIGKVVGLLLRHIFPSHGESQHVTCQAGRVIRTTGREKAVHLLQLINISRRKKIKKIVETSRKTFQYLKLIFLWVIFRKNNVNNV